MINKSNRYNNLLVEIFTKVEYIYKYLRIKMTNWNFEIS